MSRLEIVCLAGLPWEGRASTWYHLSRALAPDHDVLFVDPPVSILRQPFGRARAMDIGPGLRRLVPPPILYRVNSPWNRARYGRAVRREVARLGWQRPVLWNVAPLDFSEGALQQVPHALHVLHFTDAFWDFPGWTAWTDAAMARIRPQTDLALGTSPPIVERLRAEGFPAHLLPQGVEVDRFAAVAAGDVEPPRALTDLPRPRIGFVGRLDRRLDVELVRSLARAFPSVVLVGPSVLPSGELASLIEAGCFMPGAVPHDETAAWMAGFDVAVLPYRTLPSVVASRPLKLLEYVAAGLPVVSAPIPAAEEWPHDVTTASGPEEFVAAVGAAAGTDRTRAERLAAVERARPHGWARQAERMVTLIREALVEAEARR